MGDEIFESSATQSPSSEVQCPFSHFVMLLPSRRVLSAQRRVGLKPSKKPLVVWSTAIEEMLSFGHMTTVALSTDWISFTRSSELTVLPAISLFPPVAT